MSSPIAPTVPSDAAVLRHAVTTLRLGLVEHQVVEPEQWDRAVRTLARCHLDDTCPSRRRIHAVFRAVRWDCLAAVAAAISELDDALRPHLEAVNGDQLTLFDPATGTARSEEPNAT